MERFAHIPHAPDRWINVGEHPQDAVAVRGPRREGVHVQQVIAFMQREVASLLFQRTEAGKIQLHLARVWSKKLRDKLRNRCGEVPHDGVHALAMGELSSTPFSKSFVGR